MLALCLIALQGHTLGSGFTLDIDGGPTPNDHPVVLPQAPPWANRVLLVVREDVLFNFGSETDGDGTGTWSANAWVGVGWQMRAGNVDLIARRTWASTSQWGVCDPFDGVIDGDGSSGASYPQITSRTAAVTLPLSQTGSLTIGARRIRDAWTTSLFLPPGAEESDIYWLNRTSSSTHIVGTWLQ